jgi:hypothetical protein
MIKDKGRKPGSVWVLDKDRRKENFGQKWRGGKEKKEKQCTHHCLLGTNMKASKRIN